MWWLGEETEDSPSAMELLSSITQNFQGSSRIEAEILAHLKVICEDRSEERKQSWIALRKLIWRHY